MCDEPERDQARVNTGQLVPTAPLPGSRFMEPPAGTPARALEDQALADVGLAPTELAQAGRDLPGARRPVVTSVTLGDPPLQGDSNGPGTARLFFSLPAGSYATVLLEALGVAVGS